MNKSLNQKNVCKKKHFCSLTPPPLKNKNTRLNPNPIFPSTNLFTNPKQRTDIGTRIVKGITAALILSSGYHIPLRCRRHLMTIWSETRPTIADPTVKNRRRKKRVTCQYQNGREEIFNNNNNKRTHATKANW